MKRSKTTMHTLIEFTYVYADIYIYINEYRSSMIVTGLINRYKRFVCFMNKLQGERSNNYHLTR